MSAWTKVPTQKNIYNVQVSLAKSLVISAHLCILTLQNHNYLSVGYNEVSKLFMTVFRELSFSGYKFL